MKRYFLFRLIILLLCVAVNTRIAAQCVGNNFRCGVNLAAEWELLSDVVSVCEGTPFEVANRTTSPDISFYVWNWGDDRRDTVFVKDNQTHTYTFDGEINCSVGFASFNITLEIFRLCGEDSISCHSKNAPVVVALKPRPRFDTQPEHCITDEVSFSNNSCFAKSYLWDFGDGTTATEMSPNHKYTSPGLYTVRLTAYNDCATDGVTTTKTISIVGEPEADFSYSPNDPTALCGSPTVDIIDQSNQWSCVSWNIQPMDTLKWRFTDTLMDLFSDSLRIHFFQPGDYIVTLTASNACPEDSVKIDTISINEKPIIDLVTPSVSCDEQVLSSSDILRSSSGTITKYVWTFENASVDRIEGETFSDVRFKQSGKATLTIESPCGNQSRTVDIAVASTAPILFESDLKQICQNDSIRQLRVQPLGGIWEGLGGAANAISTDGKLNPSLLAEGTYALKYSTGSAQCPNEKLDTFSILPAVGVTLTGVAPVCNELSLNTATITTYAGAIDRYEWQYNGTVLAADNFPTLSFSPGNGALIVTVNGTCGVASDTIPIQVQKDTVINITPVNNPICAGSSPIQLQADFAGGTWDGIGIIDRGLGIFDPSMVTPNQTYDITYMLAFGVCTPITSVSIRVVNSQTAQVQNVTICTDSEPIQLVVSTNLPGNWDGMGITDTLNGIFDPSTLAADQSYSVNFNFDDPNGCSVTARGEVLVEALPVLNKLDTVQLCLSSLSNMEIDLPQIFNYLPQPTGGSSIWRGTGVTNSNGKFNPIAGGLSAGAYRVFVEYTRNDCVVTDSMVVELINAPTLGITPDTTICAGSSPIQLNANLQNGTWEGMGITNNTLGIFDPASVVPDRSYELSYETQQGACTVRASTTIRVVNSQTAQVQNVTICTDSEPTQLVVSTNLPGNWDGLGITDTLNGIFDPSTLAADQSYSVAFNFDDPNGCPVTARGEVLVEALPVLNKLDTIQLCLSNIELDLPSLVNYNPTPIGGISRWRGEGIRNTSGKFNPVASNLTEGFYKIFVEYERNDCMVMDSVVVELIQARPLMVSPDTSICISAGQLQLEANLEGGTWQPNNISPTGLIDLTQLGGGNFIFNYEYQIGTSCEQRAEVNVEVIDLRSTVNAGSDKSVCQSSGTVTFVGTPALNGIWSNNDGMNPTTGVVNVNQLAPGTYEYSYQIESETVAGCVAEDRVSLTVHALPIPAFEVSGNLCINTDLQFDNQSNGATTYRWDFGIANSNQSNPTFAFPTAGDYNIMLTAFTNTAPQCSATTNQMIRISEPPPAVGFLVDKREGCADLEVTFTNTSQGENLSLTWNFGNGQSSSENQPPAITYGQGRTDTTYYIQIRAGNNCGDRSFRDSVLVRPRPVARLGTDRAKYCSGDTTLIINASFGQPDRYRWTYGNGQSSNDSIPIRPIYYTDSLSREYLITLLAENECGMDTDSFNIRIDPTDVTAFYRADSTVFCAGDSIRLESFSTPYSRLFWDFGDGNSTTIAQPVYVYNSPGVYRLVHYAFGCGSDSMMQQITIKPTPVPAFDIAGNRCVEDTIRLMDRSDHAVSLLWQWGDGTSSSLSQPTHRYLMNGNYEITLTATAENRCSASVAKPLTIRALPVFQINAPDSVCANAPTAITVTANELFSSYNWQFGDGEVGNGRLITHSYSMSDAYTLSVLITDAFGCKSSQETSIFVRPTPTAAFSYELLRNCPPANGFFLNESQTANGFEWKFSDNFTTTTVDVERMFEQGGTYTAELIASYDGICFDTTQQTLTINATPQAQLEVQDVSCFGENNGTIIVSNNLGHRVNVSGENYQQSGDNLFEALRPGTYEVEVISREGCDTLYQVEIFEPDSLFVDILKDTIFLVIGERAIIQVNANKSGLNYNWFPELSDSISLENTFEASPILSGWHYLTASDETCSVTDSVYFSVNHLIDLYIPDAFTPNWDNINDIFFIQAGRGIKEVSLFQIFDRWGDKLFEQCDFQPNDPNLGWDGRHKGRDVNPAVYIYRIVFSRQDDVKIMKYGELMLIR